MLAVASSKDINIIQAVPTGYVINYTSTVLYRWVGRASSRKSPKGGGGGKNRFSKILVGRCIKQL